MNRETTLYQEDYESFYGLSTPVTPYTEPDDAGAVSYENGGYIGHMFINCVYTIIGNLFMQRYYD